GMRSLPINGEFYAFDGTTGKVKWQNPAPNKMLVLDQLQEMPIILLTARYNQWLNGANRINQQVVALQAFDKRTGKRLYDDDSKRLYNSTQFHTLHLDAMGGKIELISQTLKITFFLNSDAAKAESNTTSRTSSATSADPREERLRRQRLIEEAERLREARLLELKIRQAAEKK